MSIPAPRKDLRNIAIIAHVDHGKTTLVDAMLRFTGSFRENQAVEDRVMDSQDLERERGITIASKSTAVEFEGVRVQLVDTPGHADFGGEVERVLGMVDSVLLLVDAVEGVMPQTRFVLRKALEHQLRPIVVVNKIDRPEQRAEAVIDEVFDLLVELDASDEQLDFPVVYTSAKQGTASREVGKPGDDLRPLLETVLEFAPAPCVDTEGPLQFQAVTLGYDDFVGRLVIGRVERGAMARGAQVVRLPAEGAPESFRVTKLFGTRGIERVDLDEARAGDIAILAGVDSIEIGDTICAPEAPEPLPRIAVDPPTIRVQFSVNTSPFAGREGRYVTSRQIGDRLRREALGNVSIRVEEAGSRDTFTVAGRGELQIAVLIETLRRDGYEFAVSRPEIILREVDGRRCEPVEDVVIEVPEAFAGSVMEKLAQRKGRMESMEQSGQSMVLRFVVPSRGLFGYRNEFLSDTRGEGTLHRTVTGYEPYAGDLPRRSLGAIVATDPGQSTPYAIFKIQERATLFVGAGEPIYEGQIVGESRRPGDMNVHICRTKKLDNMRAAGKDENAVLTPPRRPTIESGLEWIEDDELLEVTPESLRLRKQRLSRSERKR
ncbi:MAG: translational GTPase TypA [Myxococcota bacterium]